MLHLHTKHTEICQHNLSIICLNFPYVTYTSDMQKRVGTRQINIHIHTQVNTVQCQKCKAMV